MLFCTRLCMLCPPSDAELPLPPQCCSSIGGDPTVVAAAPCDEGRRRIGSPGLGKRNTQRRRAARARARRRLRELAFWDACFHHLRSWVGSTSQPGPESLVQLPSPLHPGCAPYDMLEDSGASATTVFFGCDFKGAWWFLLRLNLTCGEQGALNATSKI